MLKSICIVFAGLAVATASAAIVEVDFEQPDYTIGTLDAQTSANISWQEFEPSSDASVAVPGYNSAQAGRWDVKDLGTDSDGDDMLAFFDNGMVPVFSVSGVAYVSLEANRPNGTSRAGHFIASDDEFFGAGISWMANGNVGYWGGGDFTVKDTGTAVIYEQWVPFQLDIDYTSNQVTVWYNGVQVAQDTLTGIGDGYATQLDIWLETVALADNPNPGDWVAYDDIVITPEPAAIGLILSGALLLRRRR